MSRPQVRTSRCHLLIVYGVREGNLDGTDLSGVTVVLLYSTPAKESSTVPNFQRLHHIGIPVSSIERSLPWYRDVFGLLENKKATASGDEISTALEVPGAELNVVFLAVGDQVLLELLEYESPRGRAFDRRNCDVGAVHVCFEVDDIDAAYTQLTELGVRFNHPPIRLGEGLGDLSGYAFAYFRDPDGIQLELFELPVGARN
jgi:catechol 2,3-dioxygenase-like lactoylglutathione lyase family enzyme